MQKYLNGLLVDCLPAETAEIEELRADKDAARPLRNWVTAMALTDVKVPRSVEDIYDVLTDEQKAALPEELKTSIANKKLLRSERP